ncbi:MAG: hypothetical protein ABW174_09885, partial [Flavitalea sp.]
TTATAQTNSISYELGKNGFIHNFVFDHKLKSSTFGLRGFAGSNFGRYNHAFLIGTGVYHLVGKQKYFLELGADVAYFKHLNAGEDQKGAGLVYPDKELSTIYPSANIGYRYMGRKLLFRIGISPGIAGRVFIPGGYMSLGFKTTR